MTATIGSGVFFGGVFFGGVFFGGVFFGGVFFGGFFFGGIPVGGFFGLPEKPKTVPVSCATVGLVVSASVTVRHAGGPAMRVGPGAPTTASHAPAPPSADGSNQRRPVPFPMLQSEIVMLW
ncbi:MAG: hypothetical protein WAL35_02785 [Acidimicrobiales bacterium]